MKGAAKENINIYAGRGAATLWSFPRGRRAQQVRLVHFLRQEYHFPGARLWLSGHSRSEDSNIRPTTSDLLSPRQSPAGLLAANLFCGQGRSLLSPRQSPEGLLAANLFRGQPGRSKHANTPNRRALSATLSKLGRRITHKSAPSGASTIPPGCWKTFLFFWRSRLLAKLESCPATFQRKPAGGSRDRSLIKVSGSSG